MPRTWAGRVLWLFTWTRLFGLQYKGHEWHSESWSHRTFKPAEPFLAHLTCPRRCMVCSAHMLLCYCCCFNGVLNTDLKKLEFEIFLLKKKIRTCVRSSAWISPVELWEPTQWLLALAIQNQRRHIFRSQHVRWQQRQFAKCIFCARNTLEGELTYKVYSKLGVEMAISAQPNINRLKLHTSPYTSDIYNTVVLF